ncbi:MAG TPA: KleE stable inheritance protein [Candidatus Acidoferrum sp.]|nr:KleE stable inheritance protein [Candidatus Acidoferrum sp.]
MTAANEHDKIRSLLSLAVAGALDSAQESLVENHVRTCPECAAQLDEWRALAGGLKRLPTPQISAQVLQRTVALVRQAREAEDERRATRRILAPLLAFSWVLTVFSWPLYKIASSGLSVVFDIRFAHDWRVFAILVAWTWLCGGVAAFLLSSHQQRHRRLA